MNLPQHLQKYQAPDVGATLSQNLGSAMPPHVSIGGGRFTLIDASNNEIPVPTFDPAIGVYLDACIIDVNEKMSRQYFSKPYDPASPGERPDCWSDNGIAASVGANEVPLLQAPHPRAGQPAATCGECPMSVWGSKISAQGAKIPACTQKQKTALLIPGFQTLFLLAVPPNSHSFMREYVEKCRGSGINMADVITRISFVPGVQGTLMFSGVNYIDEPTAVLRQAAYTEKKTYALVGRNDVPRTAGTIAGPVSAIAADPNIAGTGQLNPPQITQQVQQPAPFVPTPAAAAASPGWPATTPAPTAATTSPSEPAPAARRRRRTAVEMQQANGAQPVGQPAAAAPQAPFPHPGQAAQPAAAQGSFGIAQGQPAAANPELAGMLDDFFKS